MRRVLPFLRFSLVIFLLTALACPAFSEDIQTLIKDADGGNPKDSLTSASALARRQGVPQDYTEAMKSGIAWPQSRDLQVLNANSVCITTMGRAFRRTICLHTSGGHWLHTESTGEDYNSCKNYRDIAAKKSPLNN